MNEMIEQALEEGGEFSGEPVYEDVDREYPTYGPPPAGLGEAGGIAWCDVFINGFKVSLTERRDTAKAALDALVFSLRYARDKYGASGSLSANFKKEEAPERPTERPKGKSQAAPISHDETVVAVDSIKYIKAKNGKFWLIATAQGFDDGVLAKPEMAPPDVDLTAWKLFEEYAPPVSMTFVAVNEKGFATRFQSEV